MANLMNNVIIAGFLIEFARQKLLEPELTYILFLHLHGFNYDICHTLSLLTSNYSVSYH